MLVRRDRRCNLGARATQLLNIYNYQQPCDFWAFPELKRRLAGQKFDTDEEMKTAVITEMARMCQGGLNHVWDKWEKRMRKVIACQGDYIEK